MKIYIRSWIDSKIIIKSQIQEAEQINTRISS
jgi:hypothetical protein